MIKIVFILFFAFGCGSTPQNATTEQMQNALNEDFNVFVVKFSKDKIFQSSRILFPITLTTENEQGKPVVRKIIQKEWKYTDFLGLKKKDKRNEVEIEIESNSTAKIVYSIQDSGIYVVHHFVKKEGKWYMKSITDESD